MDSGGSGNKGRQRKEKGANMICILRMENEEGKKEGDDRGKQQMGENCVLTVFIIIIVQHTLFYCCEYPLNVY